MPRLRYTVLAFTINTNKAATTTVQERALKDDLERFIKEDLGDPASYRGLIDVEPSFDALEHISIDAVGIERGGTKHRIHAHFVMTIQHTVKVVLKKGLQKRWQDFVNSRLLYSSGSNVNIDLLSGRFLNYAAKYTGTTRQIAVLNEGERVLF